MPKLISYKNARVGNYIWPLNRQKSHDKPSTSNWKDLNKKVSVNEYRLLKMDARV